MLSDLIVQKLQLKDIIALLPQAWRDEIFKAPAGWIAEATGHSDSAVCRYRTQHGIPRANGPGGAPRGGKEEWVRTVKEIIRRIIAGEPFPNPPDA